MNTLTIINLFILPSLITTLILGAILNYKSLDMNKYQKTIMTTYIYWAAIMLFVYIKFFIEMRLENRFTISYISDICGVQVLILGTMCFVSLISYPVVILEAKYLTLKSWGRRIKPTALTLAVYFIINLIAGANPFTKYASLGEFFANISTVTVISRLGLISTLICIWGYELLRIWRIVPLYDKYIEDNFADSQCNVKWIRSLIIYISMVMIAYCTMLFFGSPLVNLIYITSVMLMFIYMITMSLTYRTSERVENINNLRNPNNPDDYDITKIDNPTAKAPTSNIAPNHEILKNTLAQIDEWMEKESPYTSIHFSTDDILFVFPHLTRYDLTILFRNNSETFQSYVRRFRIKKACEIMCSQDNNAYNQKIYAVVGFSHYSSFSRSFVSMLETSPSKFIKLSPDDKRVLIESLNTNNPARNIS